MNETIELNTQLMRADHQVAAVLLNEVSELPLPSSDDWESIRPKLTASEAPAMVELATLTDRWLQRQARQSAAREALESQISAPIITLPSLLDRALGFAELQQLSHTIADGWSKL